MLTHEERVEIILRDMDNRLQICFDLNGSHIEHIIGYRVILCIMTFGIIPMVREFWTNL